MADPLAAAYERFLLTALQLGVVAEGQAGQFRAVMAAARAVTSQYLSPLIVSAWKQKP